jgi:hypothetical protein
MCASIFSHQAPRRRCWEARSFTTRVPPIACGCRRITSPVWNGAGAVPAAQFVRFRLILNELVSRRAYAPLRQELTRYGRDGRKCGSSKEERGMQQTLGVQPMSQPVDGR